jgi:hypothetical protein
MTAIVLEAGRSSVTGIGAPVALTACLCGQRK